MKLLFILILSLGTSSLSYAYKRTSINETILLTFRTAFPNASEIAWKETDEYYTVSFTEEGVRSRIVFNKNGEFQNAARYYREQKLPFYIIVNLKNRYPKRKIFGVTEYTTNAGIEFFVKMEDGRNWYTVKTDGNNEYELVEKYRKIKDQ